MPPATPAADLAAPIFRPAQRRCASHRIADSHLISLRPDCGLLDADQASRVIVLTANPNSASASRLAAHYFLVEKPYDIPALRELVDKVSAAARSGYFPSRTRRAV